MTAITKKYTKVDKIIPHQFQIDWFYLSFLVFVHVVAVYGLYLHLTKPIGGWNEFWLNIYLVMANLFCMFGIVAGTHRLWSHRSYKAKWPLRLILMIFQTAGIQEDIYEWSLKHRLHHKYSDTDADPSNISRGIVWAHIGWLFFKRHPKVLEKVQTIDTTDLMADPIVRFQRTFYTPLVVVVRGLMFTGIPMLIVDDSVWYLLALNILFYVLLLHYTWLINSIAHKYGYKPHDKTIEPSDNPILIYLAVGGGYHNYHHIFPHDYQGSEHSWEVAFNPTTIFIDFFAKIGWVYDRKRVSDQVIQSRKARTGDSQRLMKRPTTVLDYLNGLAILFWPMLFIYTFRFIKQSAI